MNYVKVAGIAWGLIYFVIGAAFSFTLGSKDFWSGLFVYLALFLLPLPIAIVALWLPRFAGAALIACVAVSVTVSFANVASSGPMPDLAGQFKFTMFHVPHIIFAAAYLKGGGTGRKRS